MRINSAALRRICVLVFCSAATAVSGLQAQAIPIRGLTELADAGAARVSEADAAIRKALSERVEVEMVDLPLTEVVEFLRSHKIPARLDRRALDDMAISTDETVSLRHERIQISSALRHLLADLELTWVIKDEMLVITHRDAAEAKLAVRVFDASSVMQRYRWINHDGTTSEDYDFDTMLEMITSTVGPSSWDEVGGPGTIEGMEVNGVPLLVVSQTEEVLDDVERLLVKIYRSTRNGRPLVAAPRRRPPPFNANFGLGGGMIPGGGMGMGGMGGMGTGGGGFGAAPQPQQQKRPTVFWSQ